MNPLAYFLIGFAPGLFFLWQVWSANTHRPDPLPLVIRTFVLGVLAAAPIVLLESLVMGTSPESEQSAFFVAFLVAGLVEEVGKFFIVRATVYDSPFLDSPARALVYSSAVALGFASIENVLYMAQHGADVIVVRAFMAVPGHVAFSGMWGLALGAEKARGASGGPSNEALAKGLGGAILLHGGYDYFLMTTPPSPVLAVGVLAVGVYLFVRQFRTALKEAASSTPLARAVRECPSCRARSPLYAKFCTACGHTFAAGGAAACATCAAPLRPDAAFCTSCGGRVVKDGLAG